MKYKHLSSLLFCLSMLLFGQSVVAESPWFVLMHTPGPEWDQNLSYFDQTGIDQHTTFMSELLKAGDMVMGGPFMDGSGGMAILKVESIEEALAIANRDPAVRSKLLKVEVRQWSTPLSSMIVSRKRKPVVAISRDAPFRVKSPLNDAPINIEDKARDSNRR
jgi:uncharacterized protein YciI